MIFNNGCLYKTVRGELVEPQVSLYPLLNKPVIPAGIAGIQGTGMV
jgi:hypothetical protein